MSNPQPIQDAILSAVTVVMRNMITGRHGTMEGMIAERGGIPSNLRNRRFLEDFFASEMEAMDAAAAAAATTRRRRRRASESPTAIADAALAASREAVPGGGMIVGAPIFGPEGFVGLTMPPRAANRRRNQGQRMRLEHHVVMCACCGRTTVRDQTYCVEGRRPSGPPVTHVYLNDNWDQCFHCLVDEAVVGSLRAQIVEEKEEQKKKAEEEAAKAMEQEMDQGAASAQM